MNTLRLTLFLTLLAGSARADLGAVGTFVVDLPVGAMRLELREVDAGRLEGSLDGPEGSCQLIGQFELDEDGEWFVEGTMECAAMAGEFEFTEDVEGQAYQLLVVPRDATGALRLELASLYPVARTQPEDLMAQSVPAPVRRVEAPLVGVWSTQVIMNSEVGSVATQLFMELRADGTLIDLGSRAMGSFPGAGLETSETSYEVVNWRANGAILEVSYPGRPWVALARFEVSADQLFLAYYDNDQKMWYRQR